MNIVTSYFIVRKLPGTIALGGDVAQHQQARQAEYLDCLQRNRQHPGVAAVHLLVEGEEAYRHLCTHVLQREDTSSGAPSTAAATPSSLSSSMPPAAGTRGRVLLAPVVPVVRLGGGLPTYADFFAYANQLTSQRLTMVCNADVYLSPTHFDVGSVQSLFQRASGEARSQHSSRAAGEGCTSNNINSAVAHVENAVHEGKSVKLALALTRYESDSVLDAPFLYDYRGSHDAFVLKPPVPMSFLAGVNHAQNSYKAENVVLHELQQHGFLTLNPAFDLRLVHRHAADVRQWFPPVDETRYGRASPCTMADAAKRIDEAVLRSKN